MRNGIRPWLVVASGGTVDTGAIDPLPEIAELCRKYGAWFHVDGAYGGLFALCDEGRELLRGIDQADSVALDPHKTLFLPYGTGAALVRDGQPPDRRVQRFGRLHPPARRVRGRAVAGRPVARADPPFPRDAPVAAAADRRRLPPSAPRSRKSSRWPATSTRRLSEIDGFDPGPPPDLSVVAFRYVPKDGDADEFTERLLKHLQQEGRVMMSGTRIDGTYYIRCAILCFRTHIEHVDEAIEAIVDGVAVAQWLKQLPKPNGCACAIGIAEDLDEFMRHTNTPAVMRWLGGVWPRERHEAAFGRIKTYERELWPHVLDRRAQVRRRAARLLRAEARQQRGRAEPRRLRSGLALARGCLGAGLCQGSGDREPRPRLRPLGASARRCAHRSRRTSRARG